MMALDALNDLESNLDAVAARDGPGANGDADGARIATDAIARAESIASAAEASSAALAFVTASSPAARTSSMNTHSNPANGAGTASRNQLQYPGNTNLLEDTDGLRQPAARVLSLSTPPPSPS